MKNTCFIVPNSIRVIQKNNKFLKQQEEIFPNLNILAFAAEIKRNMQVRIIFHYCGSEKCIHINPPLKVESMQQWARRIFKLDNTFLVRLAYKDKAGNQKKIQSCLDLIPFIYSFRKQNRILKLNVFTYYINY